MKAFSLFGMQERFVSSRVAAHFHNSAAAAVPHCAQHSRPRSWHFWLRGSMDYATCNKHFENLALQGYSRAILVVGAAWLGLGGVWLLGRVRHPSKPHPTKPKTYLRAHLLGQNKGPSDAWLCNARLVKQSLAVLMQILVKCSHSVSS